MKSVFVTNIPAPYREKVYEFVAHDENIDFQVFYCSQTESNREWSFERGDYKSQFLNSKSLNFAGRDIYLFSDVWKKLNKAKPDVVIIAGFSMPMILTYIWAMIYQKKVVSFTDAHIRFERRLSLIHRVLRKLFYRKSAACVGASQKSLELFAKYGVKTEHLFQSQLCANNEAYSQRAKDYNSRNYDVILCGRICKEKLFDFSLEVIEYLKEQQKYLKVLVVGDGPERAWLLERLDDLAVNYEYAGFVNQEQLPLLYTDAKVFLFPSKNDAWGVVANESCASGTPVISCKEVGATGELLLDSVNSRILPLDKKLWAQEINKLLNNEELWNQYSKSAMTVVAQYSYQNAAQGLISAISFAYKGKRKQ